MGNFLRRFWRKHTPLPSTASKLKNFLTARQLQSLSDGAVDPRQVVAEAAKITPFSEEDLTRQIASQLGLPVLMRLPSSNGELVRPPFTHDRLRASGATLLVTQGMITGIVCVCPHLASGILRELAGRPVYLSMWKVILENIDLAERQARRMESTRDGAGIDATPPRDPVAWDTLRLAREVLGAIISQVRECGGAHVELAGGSLTSEESQARYTFRAADNREGSGSIHPAIQEDLRKLLDRFLQSERFHEVVLPKEQVGLRLRVLLTDAGIYRVLWTEEEPGVLFPSEKQISGGTEVRESTTSLPSPASRPIFSSPAENVEVRVSEAIPASDLQVKFDTSLLGGELILVIEDCAQFATLLQKMLSREGFTVCHAASGEEALRLIEEGLSPLLCLCDLHMPVKNGFAFLHELRSRLRREDIRVIMLTSDSDSEVEVKGLEHGADGFIGKGEHPSVLLAHVRRTAERERRRAA